MKNQCLKNKDSNEQSLNDMSSKRLLLIIILIIIIITLLFFNSRPKYMKINSEEVKEIILSQENLLIIDTREELLYKAGHIPNSINVSKEEIENNFEDICPNKSTNIIVYSKTNEESKEIVKCILKQGYRFVYDLGSIDNWDYNIEK